MKAFLAIVLLLVFTLPVAALDLGAGLAVYSESGEATPLISIGLPAGQRSDVFATWSQDDITQHVDVAYALPVYGVIEDAITLQAQAGAGMKWRDFDTWRPELLYGLAISGDVSGFEGRLGWSHLETGGGRQDDNVFSVALYLKRGAR